jgi:hypothetical protein
MRGPQRSAGFALVGVQARDLLLFFRVHHPLALLARTGLRAFGVFGLECAAKRHLVTDEDKLLIDQLYSEYKILQDKLDKIGGFKFTIRGWSVTLVLASVFAVSSTKLTSPLLLFLLLIFVWLFFLLEQKQNNYSLLFGARLIQIEKILRRIIRNTVKADSPLRMIGMVPRIAHLVIESQQKPRPTNWLDKLWRWGSDPDNLLYIAQTIAIAIAVISLTHVHSHTRPELPASPIITRYEGLTNADPEHSMHKLANHNGKQDPTQTEGR